MCLLPEHTSELQCVCIVLHSPEHTSQPFVTACWKV